MNTLCFGGISALLCLIFMISFVSAEDSIRQHLLDSDDDDGFLRRTRQFYRFGRAFSPLWGNDEDSLVTKNRFVHWPGYPITPALDDDVFSRHNRQFYRIGRAYPTYQDKRFLRFGRSRQSDLDEYVSNAFLQSEEPLYRKKRSENTESKSQETKKLTDNNKSVNEKDSAAGKDIQKRETADDDTKSSDNLPYEIVSGDYTDLDKRFMRFGKRFMRFGRGDEDASSEKRFMRFGKSLGSNQDLEKRFMRFGKRFMRFGRGDGEDEAEEKRFMRFGKSGNDDGDFDKRFMRFGKRFMRFGRGDEVDDNTLVKDGEDKRFMRFGKRSKRSSSSEINSDATATS